MKKIASFGVLAALSLHMTAAVAAESVSPQGADLLKKDIEQYLAPYTQMAKNIGEGITTGGEVSVVPKGTMYEVKIPGVTLLTTSGMSVQVGTLTANVVPGETGQWVLSAAVPKTLHVVDAAKSAVGDVTIADQHLSAVWVPAINVFSKADLEYKDIRFVPAKDVPFNLHIASMSSLLNLSQNADKTWSGPMRSVVSGVEISTDETSPDNVSVAADKVAVDTAIEQVNLVAAKEMQLQIYTTLSQNKGKPELSPEASRQFIKDITSKFENYMGGYTTTASFENLKINAKKPAPTAENNAATEDVNIKVAKFGTTFGATGMNQEKGTVVVKFSMAGLETASIPKVIDGIVPRDFNLDFNISNLPVKELSKSLLGLISKAVDISTSQQNPEDKAKVENQIKSELMISAFSLPQLLVNAGTTFTVQDTHFDAPDVKTTLEGKIAANGSSPLMAVGTMNLKVYGLEEFIDKLQAADKNDRDARSMAQGLTQFATMGMLDKDATGKSIRDFKLELSPEGKTLLNGKDLSAVTNTGTTPPLVPTR